MTHHDKAVWVRDVLGIHVAQLGAAGSAKSAKLTKDEIAAAMQRVDAFQADINDAMERYQAAKAMADQLATATGHEVKEPGKDLTSRAETLRKNLASWTKALGAKDQDDVTKIGALATLTHDSMMRVLTDYERAVASAKPDKLPSRKFKTPWGDLIARDDKGAATALSYVADLSKALAADHSNFDRYFASADMLDHELRAKPMADFLANPASVQAAVQKTAQDNKGKIGDALGQARHADSLGRDNKILSDQLATAKVQTDQMTKSLAAIAKQVESEADAEAAAELTEKAERIEAAYDFMGEFVACLTNPEEAAGKLTDLAVKTGFKLLGKLDTKEIRARAADLKKSADKKHKGFYTEQCNALIGALDEFDKLAPTLDKEISELAKRFESQMKQVGEKFDTICESCTFHFYDVENAVKLAHKTLDAAASARAALVENALDIPGAIGRAVLRIPQDAGFMEQAMENEFTRINAPTIDLAGHEVEKKIVDWKSREQTLVESLGHLLEVRDKALQAFSDFGG
jgi:hypothetical protein